MKIEEVTHSARALSINKKILQKVIFTQNSLHESFNDVLKPYDLSSEQFNVLEILNDLKGKPANMCMIQEKMTAKTSNTTRLVDKLLLKRLVTREVCNENRRKIEVFITEKGVNIIKEIEPLLHIIEEKFANNMTLNELETLNVLLMKYIQD